MIPVLHSGTEGNRINLMLPIILDFFNTGQNELHLKFDQKEIELDEVQILGDAGFEVYYLDTDKSWIKITR